MKPKIVIILLCVIGAAVGLYFLIHTKTPPNQCVNNCYDNGKCVNNSCLCNQGFYGDNCENKIVQCAQYCDINGECLKDGTCVCKPYWTGPACQDLTSCPVIDGKICNDNGSCDETSGKCNCKATYHQPKCEKDILCPNNCSGSNGDCDVTSGKCICKKGFYSPDCSKTCTCTHGICDDYGLCKLCDSGWTGPNCDKACNCVNGTCKTDGSGTCVCSNGWTGPNCEIPSADICDGRCNGLHSECKCADKQICEYSKCRPCNPNNPCVCGFVNECGDPCTSDCSKGCICVPPLVCKDGKCIYASINN